MIDIEVKYHKTMLKTYKRGLLTLLHPGGIDAKVFTQISITKTIQHRFQLHRHPTRETCALELIKLVKDLCPNILL
jgi:hypothetical protein